MLLAGPIPPGLGQLAVLELLDLSLNNLEGEFNNIPYIRRLVYCRVNLMAATHSAILGR